MWNMKSEIWFVYKKYVVVICLSPCWDAEIYDIMFSKKNNVVFRKKEVYIHIVHVMLNKNTLLLFLHKTFVTVVEQIDYFCWRRCYSCRKDLLQMLSNLFLMGKRFITFAEGVTLTEQICYKCWTSCSSWERDLLLLRKSYCYRTDPLQMLNKLFLMRILKFSDNVLIWWMWLIMMIFACVNVTSFLQYLRSFM